MTRIRPIWTTTEEAWMREHPDATYEDFRAVFGEARNYQGWRIKRQRLGIATAQYNQGEAGREQAMQRMADQADRNLDPSRLPDAEPDIPTDADALERLFSAYKEVHRASRDISRPLKSHHWYADGDQPVGICFVGDVHAGGNIDYDRFEDDIRLIRETDGLHVVFMGDLIDNFKPQAKSGTGLYHALFGSPDLQVAYITTRLRQVRAPKAIALCGGNHEAFDGRWAGIDRLPALASDIGVPYFTEAGGSILAHVGEHRYHLVCKHDYVGKSQLNKGNSGRRLWNEWSWEWANADAVVLAHLHEPYLDQSMRKGEVVTTLRGGTFKIDDEWAESKGYRPAYGVPLVILYPDERRLVPFHGASFRDGVRFLVNERARSASREHEASA